MTNRLQQLVVPVAMLVGLGACGVQDASPPDSVEQISAGRTLQVGDNSVVATPQGRPKAPGPVIGRVPIEADLKANYPKINDLFTAPEADAAVIGVVEEVEYRTLDGTLAQTILTVSVDKSRMRAVPATIKVWEDGGYVRVSDIARDNADKFPDSAPEMEDGWIEFAFKGARHPEAGQTVLLFLRQNPNGGEEDSFQEVGSVFGRFTLENGRYTRTARGEDWENTISRSAVDAHFVTG